MMTSRAEYRLILRQDNADLRLTPLGRKIGLVSNDRWEKFCAKRDRIDEITKILDEKILTPSKETNSILKSLALDEIHATLPLSELLRRPDVTYEKIRSAFELPEIDDEIRTQIETQFFYSGYIEKQIEQVAKMERLEDKLIPENLDYNDVSNLRDEAREKLISIQPRSIGQATRISGVSPADISVLLIYLESHK